MKVTLRDRRGKRLRDTSGLVRRMGAPGGGSSAKRNVTVCGELVDTSHLFNPRYELLSWACRWLSTVMPVRFAWANPLHVPIFQDSDVEQAEESMLVFDALLTGDGARVPDSLARIDDLRAQRRRLEDSLRSTPAVDCVALIREIEGLELEIGALREALPPLATGTTLLAFRASYDAAVRRSRALHC